MKETIGFILLLFLVGAIGVASTVDGQRAENKHLYNKCTQRNNTLTVIEAEKQCAWIKEDIK